MKEQPITIMGPFVYSKFSKFHEETLPIYLSRVVPLRPWTWLERPIRAVVQGSRACSVPLESEQTLEILDWHLFLSANRYPPRIKSGAGWRRNMR